MTSDSLTLNSGVPFRLRGLAGVSSTIDLMAKSHDFYSVTASVISTEKSSVYTMTGSTRSEPLKHEFIMS